MAQYIEVTEQFYNEFNYYINEPNQLHIVKIPDGRYVTDINSRNEFYYLFKGNEPVIELNWDDFDHSSDII